ncbi:MAG: 3-hydroxyacyl-CoA dehydrogenase NAD-binding domain-containing protein [Thermodesulfobacteriota bacterium]
MKRKIERVTVIGAGVMGATIAAHMANVGVKTNLLDIVPPQLTPVDEAKGITRQDRAFRDRFAANGLNNAVKSKPASFYIPEDAKRVRIGNIEDNLEWLKESDWVVEVVVENLDIKKKLFGTIVPFLRDGAILSSNTSGIPIKAMAEALPPQISANFLGAHFFNPPRYMKLLEIIPGPRTDPEVITFMADFCETVLGKGVVFAKDTPNFIANRIGVFGMMDTVAAMAELGLTPDEVDAMTGPAIGHPKSATFRTADLVGLDTLCHVAGNVYDGVPGDEKRETFKVPGLLQQMLEKKLLGDKTGGGFYKMARTAVGKAILSLNLNTFEYKEQKKVKFDSLQLAKLEEDTGKRIAALYYGGDVVSRFLFQTTSALLIYSANRIPEIADDIVNIDNALRWGFAWELGPFEIWDALGLGKSVARMEEAGYPVPAWVKEMLAAGKTSFYQKENGVRYYYDLADRDYREVPTRPEIILLPSLKDRNKVVRTNPGATLYDLGDGVAGLELHTKMNAIDQDLITMITASLDEVREKFDGLVIGNQAQNFSVGANIFLVLAAAKEGRWDELGATIKGLQDALMAVKYFEKPVVAAPAGMALGGGCEICLAAHKVRAAAESYIGLVEVGVGVVPAGGGCKELLLRNMEGLFEVARGGIYPDQIELKPFVARAFENIALAKVSTSAREAQKLGILRWSDKITINRDFLLDDAKKTVLAMNLEGFQPPRYADEIRVMGRNGLAVFRHALYVMHKSGYISDYDREVAGQVAWVLCGGEVHPNTMVNEQYILDLEREAFLSLCGKEKTQARIEHMLVTGKPLRN